MATPADPVIGHLQSSLKSNLVALSHILSFHSSLSQLNASDFAPRAPLAMRRKLQAEAAGFDALCDQVEQRVLRAMAVLERDARKAAGEPLETQPTTATQQTQPESIDILSGLPSDPSAPEGLLFPFNLEGGTSSQAADAAGLQALALDIALPAADGAAGGGIGEELDFSILGDMDLFPSAGDGAAGAGEAPSLFPTSAGAGEDGGAQIPATVDGAAGDVPDLASLLSMVNSFSAPGAVPGSSAPVDVTAATDPAVAAPGVTSSAADAGTLDLSAAGLDSLFGTGDLSAGVGGAGGDAGGAGDGGLAGLMDFDMSAMDFSNLDMNLGGAELDLDELLKGFNTGQGEGSGAT